MNCILNGSDEKTQITVGQEEVLRNCLHLLQLTSEATDTTKCTVEAACFPDLPPLTLLQVEQIQWYSDYENAFTNGAISDDTQYILD